MFKNEIIQKKNKQNKHRLLFRLWPLTKFKFDYLWFYTRLEITHPQIHINLNTIKSENKQNRPKWYLMEIFQLQRTHWDCREWGGATQSLFRSDAIIDFNHQFLLSVLKGLFEYIVLFCVNKMPVETINTSHRDYRLISSYYCLIR